MGQHARRRDDGRCALDVREACPACLAAGAAKLRLRDFASVPRQPLTAAWRCWQAGHPACVGVPRPPPTRSTPIPAAMVETVDGILQLRVDGWTKLFGAADTLETVALECGETGEDDESHGHLRETLAELCGTRALRKMALGFFERVTDDDLRPLWGGGARSETGRAKRRRWCRRPGPTAAAARCHPLPRSLRP